jgi:hypothetical protein
MGSDPWVVNASLLILLGKTGHLDLLAALADTVVVPQAVANEVGAKPDAAAIPAELTGIPAYRVAGSEPTPLKSSRGTWAQGRLRSSPMRSAMALTGWSSTTWKRDAAPRPWGSRSSGRSVLLAAPSPWGRSHWRLRSLSICAGPGCMSLTPWCNTSCERLGSNRVGRGTSQNPRALLTIARSRYANRPTTPEYQP